VVLEATGPRLSDRRTRTSYLPDRKEEQAEIAARHARGLQYIGDWHTHPEDAPFPSIIDINSISECFNKSLHALNGFVLVIVGKAVSSEWLNVSLCDGCTICHLNPITPGA
jgi:integrative and conjugative element protein (TIGR02256 family)